MATKQQEREALNKITAIIKELGEDSYIAAAFDGCLDVAEQNISNDFMDSMKKRTESARKEADELREELHKRTDNLRGLTDIISQKEEQARGREEQIANLNSIIKMQSDRITELEQGVDAGNDRIKGLADENVRLKARLYDILMK
jgi:uncharacterized coiled-coil DUF342 family protein